MSVCEGRESEKDENQGLWASDLRWSLWDVALKSTQPERPRGVVVVRHSQIDKPERPRGVAVVTSLWSWSDFVSSL
ncbi:hypothetical protein F2Q69_00061025 [Brassica cretica]|uniref:Uncharacterized protein n=1 Tax=Brassica cretica TaxID=69181 RepID=A0A8S9RJN4_BRACR|nr:hypothetical protein F2Q69_00061025 [Brassica cretica]